METPNHLSCRCIRLDLYRILVVRYNAVTQQNTSMPIHEQILMPQQEQQSQRQSDEKGGVASVIGYLLGLVLADDELIQAPTDLLGRREARPRRGRLSGSGVGVGRGRRQGEGAGSGREEAASCGEHDARGRRGWDQPPAGGAATYSPMGPISRRGLLRHSSVQLFKPAVALCSGALSGNSATKGLQLLCAASLTESSRAGGFLRLAGAGGYCCPRRLQLRPLAKTDIHLQAKRQQLAPPSFVGLDIHAHSKKTINNIKRLYPRIKP